MRIYMYAVTVRGAHHEVAGNIKEHALGFRRRKAGCWTGSQALTQRQHRCHCVLPHGLCSKANKLLYTQQKEEEEESRL